MEKSEENLHKLYSNIGDLKNDFRNQNLYEFVLKRVRGKKVLDVGCGAGHFLNLAKSRGFEVYGWETSEKLIELSKKIYKKDLNISIGTAEDIGRFPKKVDTVTMIDVLEHIENDKEVLRKIKPKLSKDGRLVILVPAYQTLYGKRDKSIGHYRRYSAGSLKKVVEESGYRVEELRYWNILGIAPYFISEKIMKKQLNLAFRDKKKKGKVSNFVNKTLYAWFEKIENPVNFKMGLSVLCVAKPKWA